MGFSFLTFGGLVFLHLSVRDSYVWGFGNSYFQGLVLLCLGVCNS